MLTYALAIYAAVVSTALAIVTFWAYRSGGPRLSGDAFIRGRYDREGPTLHVNVYNRGRGAITVRGIWLWAYASTPSGGRKLPSVGSTGWPLAWSRDFPIRLEGHSGEDFSIPAHDIAKTWLTRQLKHMQVDVDLATGMTLKLPVDTENIDVLDPGNLPVWEPDYFEKRSESQAEDGRPDS